MQPSSLFLLLLLPLLSLAANAHPLLNNNNNNLAPRSPLESSSLGKAAFKGAESYKKRAHEHDEFGKAGWRDTAESYKRSSSDVDEERKRSVPLAGHYGTPDYQTANPFGGKRANNNNNNEARFVDDNNNGSDVATTSGGGGKFGKGSWGGGGRDYVRRGFKKNGAGAGAGGKAGWKNSGSDFKRDVVAGAAAAAGGGEERKKMGEDGTGEQEHERMERHECGGRGRGKACY